jgi:tRNA A-37 threonylcarbamoyl transferase component Bud32
MDRRYPPFCTADPLFYDRPGSRPGRTHYADDLPLPDRSWAESAQDGWRVLRPSDVALRGQGWKVHVSATPANARSVINTVYDYCIRRRIAFKHLDGPDTVLARNAKDAARAGSGKIITIYPDNDDDHLVSILDDLGAALAGQPGPYILSDLRIGDGPLYVRYGGFVTRWTSIDGVRVPAIKHPNGTLVADERRPGFHPPSWVSTPDCLLAHVAARSRGPAELPFAIDQALHFSNSGGVYLASLPGRPDQVVLKEARPDAGLDRDGIDAVARLDHEERILRLLDDVVGVPRVLNRLRVWEHHYLVLEHLPGQTLSSWVATRYPLMDEAPAPAELAQYAAEVDRVIANVRAILDVIHSRGVVYGDLHTRNVLVDETGAVHLVDFEVARRADEQRRPAALAAPGFRAPADLRGVDADLYSLAKLKLSLLCPLTMTHDLAPSLIQTHIDFAEDRFHTRGHLDQLRQHLRAHKAAVGDTPPPASTVTPRMLADAILHSATPHRADRLFPGDIEQFTYDGLCLGYGAAGVLFALHATGHGKNCSHEQWLLEAVRTKPPDRPGFYDGAHGIAYALHHLGHHGTAYALIDGAAHGLDELPNHDVHSGLAGIALCLLDLGHDIRHQPWTDRALQIGHRLAAQLHDLGPATRDGRAGHLHGWSGPALLFVRLYDHDKNPRWLDLAELAVGRDLNECTEVTGRAKLQVRDTTGHRTLPYLGVGSAGILIALHELSLRRPKSRNAATIDPLLAACCTEFVGNAGLAFGRAGLIAALLPHRHTTRAEAALNRHVERLSLVAIDHGLGKALPGNQLLRLSMDLLTGTAGVLLALSAVAGSSVSMPTLPASRAAVLSG